MRIEGTRHYRIVAILCCMVSLPLAVRGAEVLPEDRGSAALWQALKRIETNGRILYLTAHPDDEDAGLLTYLARGRGYDVTLMSLTRGESGANLITGDTFDRLGVLRTLELEKAAQHYGVKLRFAGFADYGYSKTLDEAWRKWNRDEVVAEVVRAIQELKPHVIITRFTGTVRDGHGQHQASGVAGKLAFEACENQPWKPLKYYSGSLPTEEWSIRLDSGAYEPILGRSYSQIGREGYRWQRSQAMGAVIARPGPALSYLRLAGTRAGQPSAKETDLFERLPDMGVPAEVATHVAAAKKAFRADNPSECAPHLADALRIAPEGMKPRIRYALNVALGIELEALVEPGSRPTGMAAQFRPWTTFAVAEPGKAFRVSGGLHVRSGASVDAVSVTVAAPDGWTVSPQGENVFSVVPPTDARSTAVHWRRDSIQESRYRLEPRAQQLVIRASYKFRDVDSFVEAVPETSSIDSIGLGLRRRLAVGPAVSIALSGRTTAIPSGLRNAVVECVVRKVTEGEAAGMVKLSLPAGVRSEPAEAPFRLAKEGEESRVSFRLTLPAGAGEYKIAATAHVGAREYASSFLPVTYSGLETLYVSDPAEHVLRVIDVRAAAGLRIGYVMGSGDEVPDALKQLGVAVDLLGPVELASADLSKYNTILLGIRAYAVRPDVKSNNGRLLEYVKNGGVLVVQYNTQEYDGNYGPFPYTMTARAEEISEEDSPVKILEPGHPVFQSPNRITAADFDNWVEQRGSKFWMTWAPEYKALLETQDQGQTAQRGGWLEARLGKGLYIYCAYAWYRQLPYAVPGAFRLFANLVSLGASDSPWRQQ